MSFGSFLEYIGSCSFMGIFFQQNFHRYLYVRALPQKISYCEEKWKKSTPFERSVAFSTEANHLICTASHITGFYMQCNTGLKWVKRIREEHLVTWSKSRNPLLIYAMLATDSSVVAYNLLIPNLVLLRFIVNLRSCS